MSFLSSFVTVKARDLHDGAIKLVAQWDPETVAESQIQEWNTQAKEMASTAAKAAADAKQAEVELATLQTNIDRYAQAAEKLAESNPEAANKAADQALSLQSQLESAQAQAKDARAWATETFAAAEQAEKLVMEGRSKIEAAKRDQARALQEAKVAEQRRADRERMAGITHGLSGTDAALDALSANAANARQKAAADNIRSGVLGKSVEADAAINEALAAVDGSPKPQTLADKLAALKH